MRRPVSAAYIGMAAMLIFNLAPFYWAISSSLKSNTEVVSFPATLWPRNLSFQAYREIWLNGGFPVYFANSLIVSLATAVLAASFAVLAGYGFSRFRFRFRTALMSIFLASQLIPSILLVLPYFKLLTIVGLYDTRIGLIAALTTMSHPFSVWMLAGYMDSVPIEIDQAAMIDGATRFRVLIHVVLPNAIPGIVATMTFAFLMSWGDLIWALCLITDETKITLTLGITRLVGEYRVEWAQIMAATVVAAIIPAGLYLFAQRYIVNSFVESAVRE